MVLFCQVEPPTQSFEKPPQALSAASFCLSVACFVVASHDFLGSSLSMCHKKDWNNFQKTKSSSN